MVINKIKKLIAELFAKRQYSSMVKSIDFGKPLRVLDVGGSSGLFSKEVIKKLPKNTDYYIIDINEASITEGRKRYPQFKFLIQNAEEMSFKNKEFDLVICKDVLHHCKNPEKAVSEIKRVGKKYVIIEARRGDRWLDDYLENHNHFTFDKFKQIVKPKKIFFLDILWPRFRYMFFFLFSPIIPKSKNSFMVAVG